MNLISPRCREMWLVARQGRPQNPHYAIGVPIHSNILQYGILSIQKYILGRYLCTGFLKDDKQNHSREESAGRDSLLVQRLMEIMSNRGHNPHVCMNTQKCTLHLDKSKECPARL